MSLNLHRSGLIPLMVGPKNWFVCEVCDAIFKGAIRKDTFRVNDVIVCEACFIDMGIEYESELNS